MLVTSNIHRPAAKQTACWDAVFVMLCHSLHRGFALKHTQMYQVHQDIAASGMLDLEDGPGASSSSSAAALTDAKSIPNRSGESEMSRICTADMLGGAC